MTAHHDDAVTARKDRLWVAGALGVLLLAVPALRKWQLRWGADHHEVIAALAGDDLIAEPDLVATRAITITAPASQVWPWLAQLGQARGGFYSYDVLENLVGCDIHSAERIVAAWQHVEVGDEVKLHPDVSMAVAGLEEGRALVLRGAVPMGKAAAPYDCTWAFVLRDRPDGSTRLVMRERYGYSRRWAGLLIEPVEAVSFVMSRKMLMGIRDRAEAGRAQHETTRTGGRHAGA
ncbi:SRPBCC family protein [Amycolatopsis sp. NBC_01307]|uniref:SRPBCC family protein n=1 Tax=Amycolatopsis sp. NBC_01307 TaxID=2903561 RepID=UPI002E0F9947|nr:SRPBCC family protein [Amycolatopsis sp. NBC_01307]